MRADQHQYETSLMGQYRLYMDRAAAFYYWSSACAAAFLALNMAVLFVTVDKEFSPALFLILTAFGGVFAAATGLVQAYKAMPPPKAVRTFCLLGFLGVSALFPLVTFCGYVIACVIDRKITFRSVRTFLEVFCGPVFIVLMLIFMRFFVEARFVPSSSMMPNLQIGDRVAIENVSSRKGEPIKRGEIVVFTPPDIMLAGRRQTGLDYTLGNLTGFPGLPSGIAYIKRVVGLPGDKVEIRAGDGVYINGSKLDESSYLGEPANYNLKALSDIGGRSMSGGVIHPYLKDEPIVVPPNMVFLLGDNRNNSEDSHVFGFVAEPQIIGRCWDLFHPTQSYMHVSNWHRPAPASANP